MESETKMGLALAALTAVLWGMYGPALERARGDLWSPFKPFVFVGLAYTIWGVLTGLAAMLLLKDSYSYSGSHLPAMKWGFLAGSLGAFGAMALTMAMFKARNAGLVMPIVYGGAVSVTALITLFLVRSQSASTVSADPRMWLGMALIVVGIVLVVRYSPRTIPVAPGLAVIPTDGITQDIHEGISQEISTLVESSVEKTRLPDTSSTEWRTDADSPP